MADDHGYAVCRELSQLYIRIVRERTAFEQDLHGFVACGGPIIERLRGRDLVARRIPHVERIDHFRLLGNQNDVQRRAAWCFGVEIRDMMPQQNLVRLVVLFRDTERFGFRQRRDDERRFEYNLVGQRYAVGNESGNAVLTDGRFAETLLSDDRNIA